MAASKVKNILILALVLVNAFLLALVIPTRLRQTRQQAEVGSRLQALFAAEGLEFDPALLPDEQTLYELELSDDAAAERTAAAALLGDQVLITDDATRFQRTYRSDSGQCGFSSGSGAFEAVCTGRETETDLQKASEKLLSSMGLSWFEVAAPVRVRAGVYTLAARQKLLGVPVLHGGVTLTYENAVLTGISGVWYPGTPVRVSQDACSSAADALVAFLASRNELGWIGDRITAVTQGYIRVETPSASVIHMTPVWLLSTDTGDFQVDGMTRAVTAVEIETET